MNVNILSNINNKLYEYFVNFTSELDKSQELFTALYVYYDDGTGKFFIRLQVNDFIKYYRDFFEKYYRKFTLDVAEVLRFILTEEELQYVNRTLLIFMGWNGDIQCRTIL